MYSFFMKEGNDETIFFSPKVLALENENNGAQLGGRAAGVAADLWNDLNLE